ncbi:MAG: BtpA/SgcQ family protein [Polyangiaceae bacterium]|nr:BtpA/SgcQ family protein [Polyangiaceae bacterium]
MTAQSIPRLIGVIHLPPLPGSPRFEGDLASIAKRASAEAALLEAAGFDAVMIENFGDAPFLPGRVEAVTVAAMTACGLAVRERAPKLALGINVLRNDAESALAVASCTQATMVRVNVHSGARVTDQGVIEGSAHATLRLRRALGGVHIKLLCDVDVKHSAPITPRPIEEEAEEVAARGLADAVLVTGTGTGRGVDTGDLERVQKVVHVPTLVASGATIDTLAALRRAHGVIVGTALRASGRAGDPIDAQCAQTFAEAFRRVFSNEVR